MHEYRLPMRWADLDSLNHVNNTVYVGYADEARAALSDAGELPDAPIRRVAVDFVRPMLLTHKPVVVRSAVQGDALVQQISSEVEDSPVFARVTTEFGTRSPLTPSGISSGRFPLRVRRADMTGDDGASSAKLVEYAQEARVVALAKLYLSGVMGATVLAAMDVEVAEPISWRAEPYEANSCVQKIGTSSFTMLTEVRDGETVLLRSSAVLVAFDGDKQASRPLADAERDGLQSLTG